MYRIEEQTDAIKEVQRLLQINQTGFYDRKTQNAVLAIQAKNNIDQTGIVDYETFTAILSEFHLKKNEKICAHYLSNPKFPYSKGDMDDNVGLINQVLTIVLEDYEYEGLLPRGKYFGNDTENGTVYLRKIFSMGDSDKIDEAMMNRILVEKEAIELKKKNM